MKMIQKKASSISLFHKLCAKQNKSVYCDVTKSPECLHEATGQILQLPRFSHQNTWRSTNQYEATANRRLNMLTVFFTTQVFDHTRNCNNLNFQMKLKMSEGTNAERQSADF